MAYTPTFSTSAKITSAFTTNNPAGADRESLPVTIVKLVFNETTRSIEVTCSDRRMRQCRIDRLATEKMVRDLSINLQKALDTQAPLIFVAAGGNDCGVWFYNVKGNNVNKGTTKK